MSDMEDNTHFESNDDAMPAGDSISAKEDSHHFKLSASELRQRLTIKCQKALEVMREIIHEHESLEERTVESRLELCHNLLTILSAVLDAEDWSHSPFVSKVMEPLQTMRSDLQSLEKTLEEGGDTRTKARHSASVVDSQRVVSDNDVSVFILLYQVDGVDMKKWMSQLKNLSHSIVSRPIYPNEKSAKRMIQARHNTDTDAYVKISISKQLLLDQGGRKRRDRLGQPLLALTTNKIASRSIEYFVHDGVLYTFQDEKLEQINHNG